jgi:gamma-glutamylcyclotransferase (GGCT)/AIG2-like uncharacterized protein YtfP
VPADLFAYGTLRFPDVLRALLGRVPDHAPAIAEGWRVAALDGQIYPVLVPGPGAAGGMVISGLTPAEWRVIDAWEDAFYALDRLTLVGGRPAWSYLTRDATTALPGDWSPDDFGVRHLREFAGACLAWRKSYD